MPIDESIYESLLPVWIWLVLSFGSMLAMSTFGIGLANLFSVFLADWKPLRLVMNEWRGGLELTIATSLLSRPL